MTLQERYRENLKEAEIAFAKREKELADYHEETARAICEYLVRVFSGRIEEALNLQKIEDGSITEIKKTFILACSVKPNEFTVTEADEVKTGLTWFSLDCSKLKGNLMKKFLKRLSGKLNENGIETNRDTRAYTDFQVIVTLTSEA